MGENGNGIFRGRSFNNFSSPEELEDCLRVASPGVFALFAAVFFMLLGIAVWSSAGNLEMTADVRVVVQHRMARVATMKGEAVESGMLLRVYSEEAVIASVEADEFGRPLGVAELGLPDGAYEGKLVLEHSSPIRILLGSGSG